MVRLFLASLPLVGLLLTSGTAAAAGTAATAGTAAPAAPAGVGEYWHDPNRGCGLIDNWKKTNRIQDLPGCEGELPKGAPDGELAMRDAKRLLHAAEKLLDLGQTADVDAKIAAATEIMNKAPRDPRVDWARPYFKLAIGVLESKKALAPRLGKLRQAYKAMADAAAQPKSDAQQKALVSAAEACAQAFKEAEAQGVNLAYPTELTPGKLHPLRDDQQECENNRTHGGDTATAAKPAETPGAAAKPGESGGQKSAGKGSDGGVPRAKWEKTLKGDRKKVFESHADAFPEYEGDPGPKGAAKAEEWHYGSEVFRFKRNKLLKEK